MLRIGQEATDDIIVHDIMSCVNLFVLGPLYVIFASEINCFYYSFTAVPTVTVSFPTVEFSSFCTSVNNGTACSLIQIPIQASHSEKPDWLYGYQCSDNIIIKYTPVVLTLYVINALFVPFLQVISIQLPLWSRQYALVAPFYRTLSRFCPENLDNDTRKDIDFRTSRYLSNMSINIMIL